MIQFSVRVIPRASKPGLAGTRDGALLVRLQAAPVEGAANDELIQVIARAFGVAKRDVTIVSGNRSRLKRVTVASIDQSQLDAALRLVGIDPQTIAS